MSTIRRINNVSCQWPSRPVGLIEIIGGSYISIKPEVTYKRLISGFLQRNFAVHAWSYIPNFDHQLQANEAWKQFRQSRKVLEKRVNIIPNSIRLGHSLGCKLHLLAPDGGRNCNGLISLAFNNYSADASIPMIRNLVVIFLPSAICKRHKSNSSSKLAESTLQLNCICFLRSNLSAT